MLLTNVDIGHDAIGDMVDQKWTLKQNKTKQNYHGWSWKVCVCVYLKVCVCVCLFLARLPQIVFLRTQPSGLPLLRSTFCWSPSPPPSSWAHRRCPLFRIPPNQSPETIISQRYRQSITTEAIPVNPRQKCNILNFSTNPPLTFPKVIKRQNNVELS